MPKDHPITEIHIQSFIKKIKDAQSDMMEFFSYKLILKKQIRATLLVTIIFFYFSSVSISSSNTPHLNISPSSKPAGSAKNQSLHPISYNNDFEKKDSFQYWTSDGSYQINYKGITSERSTSGEKSFKIDITFGTATYVYWKIPILLPAEGELNFKGDIFIESTHGASVSLGTNISISPAPYSGVSTIKKRKDTSQQWIAQTSNLVVDGNKKAGELIAKYSPTCASTDVGVWIDTIGLYLYGKKGARLTVFIDNITIFGNIPDPKKYKSLSEIRWANYIERSLNQLTDYQSVLKKNGIQTEKALSTAINRGYPTEEEFNIIKSKLEEIHFKDIILFPWDPISNRMLLPTTYPLPVSPGNLIKIQACPDEYEPASFVIRPLKDFSNLKISLTNFKDKQGHIISSHFIDIRLVKCWYQAGSKSIHREKKRVLVPELLLHDDSLVLVDTHSQKNYLKAELDGSFKYFDISSINSKIPDGLFVEDAKDLMPFDLKKDMNKQIFISAYIPIHSEPGTYTGKIFILNGEEKIGEMSIQICVLPFTLAPSIIDYCLYYRGKLTKKRIDQIGSEYKTPTQYGLELLDMKNHGVLYPTLYQSNNDLDLLKKSLDIRDKLGLPKDRIYILGTNTGNAVESHELHQLEKRIGQWVKLLRGYGYQDIFIYGFDEAKGNKLLSQRKAWETVHKAGAKVFAANTIGAADLVGDILDLSITSARFNIDEINKWKHFGKKVYSYANPQVGVENPELYRRNYGLDLLCYGYDGAMNYAYQHGFNHIWNDFDHHRYRDHVFTYPTSNGVIPTIAWEGFREGIDDVRYLSTLIDRNKSQDDIIHKMKQKLLSNKSLNSIRNDIINEILSSDSITMKSY